MRWNEDESAKPTMLEYHVKIIGIEKNSITIKPPTGCTGAQQTEGHINMKQNTLKDYTCL